MAIEIVCCFFFFFQAEDGIRDKLVTGVQTCALPIFAGEMRNSKSSAARRSRSRSGKCSGPKRATSASSDAMLRLRSSSCQDSIRQVLEVDHQVVAGCVVPRESSRRPVPSPLVEAAGREVLGAGRRLDDDQTAAIGQQLPFDGCEQLGPDALPLPGGLDDDPVQVVRAARPRRRTPAGVARELVSRVAAQEEVAVALELLDESLAGDDDYRFLGSYAGDELTGYACWGPTPGTRGTYDLYWIVVEPAWQGKGVGTQLLAAVERQLLADGCRLIVVETSSRAEYLATRGFYERRGYRPAARLPGYYAPGDDLVIYLKDLTDGGLARTTA